MNVGQKSPVSARILAQVSAFSVAPTPVVAVPTGTQASLSELLSPLADETCDAGRGKLFHADFCTAANAICSAHALH